jgi:hypothetical protein
MEELRVWCRARVFSSDGSVLVQRVLRGRHAPDLQAVDELAQLALLAHRSRGQLVVDQLASELSELLHLAGLTVEMEREPEARE